MNITLHATRSRVFMVVILGTNMALVPGSTFGQNLVPNPSFEEVLQCPNGPSQLAGTAFWFDPTGNLTGTPDFFHACGSGTHTAPSNFLGFQEPVEGLGHAGLFLYEGSQVLANWREYIQVELLETLVENRCYHVRVHVNLSDNSSRTTDAVGLRFYPEAVQLPNPFIPGDEPHLELASGTFLNTTDWTVLEGDYIAQGGERFLMIGNYRDNANTTVQQLSTNGNFAYALIDDVSVMLCLNTGLDHTSQQPQLTLGPHGLVLADPPPKALFRMLDAAGRLLAHGSVGDGTIAYPQDHSGMIILSVMAPGTAWHYRVMVP